MLYVVFSPFSVLLELSFLKVVPQETLEILINNYTLFISTLDYSRKWKIIFCALYVPHFCIFKKLMLCLSLICCCKLQLCLGRGGVSVSYISLLWKRKKKNLTNKVDYCKWLIIVSSLSFFEKIFIFFKHYFN